MVRLRPYRWVGKPRVEEGGIGLTGECGGCGSKKDFVVSESLYMALAASKQILSNE